RTLWVGGQGYRLSAASEIDIDVPGPKLLGEFASQKLIDKARYFRFIAEELVEFAPVEDKRSHAILGNDGRCGWVLCQESDFADEVALLQVRDLRSCDSDLRMALANKEQRVEQLVFLRQSRALGDIIELPGDEQPRNLYVVEAGEDIAKQIALSLGQAERQSRPWRVVSQQQYRHQNSLEEPGQCSDQNRRCHPALSGNQHSRRAASKRGKGRVG